MMTNDFMQKYQDAVDVMITTHNEALMKTVKTYRSDLEELMKSHTEQVQKIIDESHRSVANMQKKE